MTRGLLDTSVLVAGDVSPLPGQLAVSAVSIAELHYGVLVARSADVRATRLSRLVSVQRHFDALPVDDAVADSFGQLAARVVSRGRSLRPRSMDLLIAATAHAHGAVLYTRNEKDFADLHDLVEVARA